MNMAPDITKEWIQVTEADFNLFRDQYAPITTGWPIVVERTTITHLRAGGLGLLPMGR